MWLSLLVALAPQDAPAGTPWASASPAEWPRLVHPSELTLTDGTVLRAPLVPVRMPDERTVLAGGSNVLRREEGRPLQLAELSERVASWTAGAAGSVGAPAFGGLDDGSHGWLAFEADDDAEVAALEVREGALAADERVYVVAATAAGAQRVLGGTARRELAPPYFGFDVDAPEDDATNLDPTGAPVLDAQGRLVGLAFATLPRREDGSAPPFGYLGQRADVLLSLPAWLAEERHLEVGHPIAALDLAPNGRRVAVTGPGGELTLVALDADEPDALRLDGASAGPGAAWSPDGLRLLRTGAGRIEVLDATTGAHAAIATTGSDEADAFVWSTDGGRVFVCAGVGSPRIHSGRDLKSRPPFPPHAATAGRWTSALAVSPDGALLAQAVAPGEEGTGHVVVWDLETARVAAELATDAAITSALAFSPDSAVLAAADHAGVVRTWDVQVPAGRVGWRAGEREVLALAWTADGHGLVTGGGSIESFEQEGEVIRIAVGCTVSVWDPATGEELARSYEHFAPVTGIALGRDGIVSSDELGLVHVWDWD